MLAASAAIEADIFEVPAVRSLKTIGTSLTRRPSWSALHVVSI
jgi:hypothetical protein